MAEFSLKNVFLPDLRYLLADALSRLPVAVD